jgi:hypothetical protein
VPAELFVDTSAWYALAVTEGRDSERVAAALRQRVTARVRLVTTNLIVAETHALLLRRAGHRAAVAFVREVRRPPIVIHESSAELEERAARDWLERYDDQDFSFTDAVSFALMTTERIREALTLDHHFSAAGFVVVPG